MMNVLITDSSNPNPGKIIEVTLEGIITIKAQDNDGNVVEVVRTVNNLADVPQVGDEVNVPRMMEICSLNDLADDAPGMPLTC